MKLNASMHIHRRKSIEAFNSYSRYMAKQHFTNFRDGKQNLVFNFFIDKFYQKMFNSLLAEDFVLKPEQHFKFVVCDKFITGTFSPKDSLVNILLQLIAYLQVMFCANTLSR